MDTLIRMVLIPFAVFWLLGLFAHFRFRSSPTDIHLPLVVRLLFGNPRRDGTLSITGVICQLFGYLLGILFILRGFRLINFDTAGFLIAGSAILLSVWLIRSTQREEKLRKQAGLELDSPSVNTRSSNRTIQITPVELSFQTTQPRRNWWVVGFIVSVLSVLILGSIWVIWVMINLLLTDIASGKFANQLPFSISFIVVIILEVAGLGSVVALIFFALDVRFSHEGVRVFTFSGWHYVRWADVLQIQVKARDMIVLMTKEKNVTVPLLSFHAPEKIIAEISQRAFGWKSMDDSA